MPLQDKKWKQDQTLIKVLGFGEHRKIKIVHCGWLRTAGIEADNEHRSAKGSVNDYKLDYNISRARTKIYELAFCNPWEYFFTATLNPNKHDRTDLTEFHKKLTAFLRNCKRNYSLDEPIKFLLIPERHEDGKSWHMHGFLMGLPETQLKQFQIGDKMGKGLADKVKKGDTVYNWPDYQTRFGFCSLERIRNHEAVSKYVTKYINKSLFDHIREVNSHLYYRSRGLLESETIKKGSMIAVIEPDFVHEYGWVAELPYSDDVLNWLIEQFV